MATLLSRLDLARLDHPGRSDEALVRAIAADVIREVGIREPPVDLEMVASMLDIREVIEDPHLDVAGCLVSGPCGHVVRVRATDGRARKRFSTGHECSHTFMPGFADAPRFRCSPAVVPKKSVDELERLCDIGASELLMPVTLFRTDLADVRFGLDTVEDLAERYQASLLATANRFVTDWSAPCALVVLTERQKPPECGTKAVPQLRLQYSVTNGQWPYLRPHKSVTPGDVFDRARLGEVVVERDVVIAGICASPITVDAYAKPYPYTDGNGRRQRVIALLLPAGSRR